jgi:hypothetical protein
VDFEIELEQHIGHRKVNGVVQQIEFNQYQIYVTGPKLKQIRGVDRELIGYVSKKLGSPINYLKVSAAFGPSVKLFTQMVRAALVVKLKQQLAKAREAKSEAERLKQEADELADSDDVSLRDAIALRQMASQAAEQAARELDEINQQVEREESQERKAFVPDVNPVIESNRTAADPLPSIDELADQQNL